VATFVAYVLLGPPPCHWYFLQQVAPLALVGAIGLATLAARRARLAWLGLVAPAALVGAFVERRGHADEAFIQLSWASAARYAQIGREIAEIVPRQDAIDLVGETGALSFYSERFLVDRFSDEFRMHAVITHWFEMRAAWVTREPLATLIRLNFKWSDVVPPTPARWRLVQTRGDPPPPDPSAVRAWDTSTRSTPRARLVLSRTE